MNKERIFDAVLECFDAEEHYKRTSAEYRKKHGFGACIDVRRGLTEEVARIRDALEHSQKEYEKTVLLIEVFRLDAEQTARLYTASRFLRKWYKKTDWQFCPSADLINSLWAFVIG